MPFLTDLTDRLVSAGVGVRPTGAEPVVHSIFQGAAARLPAGDGPYLTLAVNGGTAPSRIHNQPSAKTRRPSAQVAVHAADPVAGLALLEAAYVALDGIFNTSLSGTFYQHVAASSDVVDLGLDGAGRLIYAFNLTAEYEGSGEFVPPPVVPPSAAVGAFYALIEELGGSRDAFQQPAVASNYPSGASFDALVPGSWPVVLNRLRLASGTYYFECSARVAAVGAFVAVALFNLDTGAFIDGSQLVFPSDDTVGTRLRSAALTIPATDTLIGAKLNTNNVAVGGAVWGCRIVRT